jgi:hypothetical protein
VEQIASKNPIVPVNLRETPEPTSHLIQDDVAQVVTDWAVHLPGGNSKALSLVLSDNVISERAWLKRG